MITIEDNSISLTRGDTAYLSLDVSDYTFQDGDTAILSVKESIDSEDYLFQVDLDMDNLTFIILPEYTKNLNYGKYKYDVQITTKDNEIFTVIGPSTFKITEEVTI